MIGVSSQKSDFTRDERSIKFILDITLFVYDETWMNCICFRYDFTTCVCLKIGYPKPGQCIIIGGIPYSQTHPYQVGHINPISTKSHHIPKQSTKIIFAFSDINSHDTWWCIPLASRFQFPKTRMKWMNLIDPSRIPPRKKPWIYHLLVSQCQLLYVRFAKSTGATPDFRVNHQVVSHQGL